MKTTIIAIVLTVFWGAANPRLAWEMSTRGDDQISIGPFVTGYWQSDDFKGERFRAWSADATSFEFTWKTEAGNQIGSIGITFGSPYLQDPGWQGVTIAEIHPDCRMSARARWSPASDGWFFWSIYGWTHRKYTYWGSEDAPHGHDNEFYVIFYTQETTETILSQPDCVAIGSVKVDGMVFDCFKRKREHFTQWFALCRTDTWNPNPSVNLKKVLDYWCSRGLDRKQYVTSLSWALEGFAGSAGTLKLSNIEIPNLKEGPAGPRTPAREDEN